MSNFDRIRNAPRRRTTITLAIDPNDVERLGEARHKLEELEKRLASARLAEATAPSAANSERVLAMQERLDQLEEELPGVLEGVPTYTLHLEQLPVERIEELRFQNRPTKQQKERSKVLAGDARAVPQYDEERYPPALLCEAVTQITYSDDPENPTEALSLEMAAEMVKGWSQKNTIYAVAAVELLAQEPTWIGDLGKG